MSLKRIQHGFAAFTSASDPVLRAVYTISLFQDKKNWYVNFRSCLKLAKRQGTSILKAMKLFVELEQPEWLGQ